MNKTKKWIKLKNYTDFDQAGEICIQLDDEYYKNGKTLKSKKFIIINAKIWMETWKLS